MKVLRGLSVVSPRSLRGLSTVSRQGMILGAIGTTAHGFEPQRKGFNQALGVRRFTEPGPPGSGINERGQAISPYRLAEASEKYQKEISVPAGEIVPANERPDFCTDHWFELPIDDLDANQGTFPGRLFSTRMPQGITPHWKDGSQVGKGMTDPEVFKRKVKENGVTDVFVLVETENPNEPEQANSGDLLDFYKSCGLEVHHRPIEDYSLPTVKAEEENINDITECIVDGKGCLVHCWGGSGRTGTVVIGVLKQLGSRKPIRDARKVKSVYLDMAEQEQFIENLSLTIREDMVKRHPHFANVLVMEHLVQLCEDPEKIKDGAGLVTDDERKALTQLFQSMDHDGSGSLSIAELLPNVRGLCISTPATASLITEENVGKVLQKLEPGAVDISLALFIKLMHSTVALAAEAHEAIAINEIRGATIDSSGRATAKYLLSEATSKYKKAIYTEGGEVLPANEHPDFDQDHWFELPVASLEALADTENGRLFSTRMPQGITPHWKDGSQVEKGMTDPEVFKRKVKENGVTDVFVLVETENPNEPEQANSGDLFDFYKSCGLEVHHRPIEDYSLPTVEAEQENISDIMACLVDGKGCLVHCWGGSGRTGTVVIGVLKELGCQKPIREARKVKSVYLDIAEQEQFVADLSLTMCEEMVKRHPRFATVLVNQHLADLCAHPENLKDGSGLVLPDERQALEELFHQMDADGSGTLSPSEFTWNLRGIYSSSEGAAAPFSVTGIQKLIRTMKPGAKEVDLELFMRLMHATCALDAEAKSAISKKEM